jgi:hypothetical protein
MTGNPSVPTVKPWSARAPLVVENSTPPAWQSRHGPGERVLHFPSRRSMGVLYATYWGRRLPGVLAGGWWKLGSARGTVIVPAGNQVWLAVGDRAAANLAPLSNLSPDALQVLSLEDTPVNDDDMRHVACLTGLRDLSLHGTRVSPDGLEPLCSLTQLRRLDLGETRTTDAGLGHLAGLRQLRELHLDQTDIHGEGLAFLEELHHLSYLNLGYTDIFSGMFRMARVGPVRSRLSTAAKAAKASSHSAGRPQS